jgi:hypothetical protein
MIFPRVRLGDLKERVGWHPLRVLLRLLFVLASPRIDLRVKAVGSTWESL